ncbi:MAG TPA: NAD/NADP octopine/nopaline dehydrogenase family protein [Bosea sp. (in: a-proteobacteria)]|jgi:opine dehydrogenase|uniref:NAD/NADP octopine/nopaline dehydrogenase family protein n=1 Tax=Bosea sp. (in: a-proteobacteria) TaxID=1871050 RepID=UPI002E0D4FC5|nr:NAD/NADP octopine/nopaline dehydrogenase family protein [Bosea sp. (in: a-proteobacteria)]
MRVAIMGAGAVAFASAAFLIERGHEAVLWSPSGKSTAALATGQPLLSQGKISGEFRPVVAASCEAALAGADVVLIALPANGHKLVMDAMVPLLTPGQAVVISSHASLGGFYLAQRLKERGVELPIIALSTTVLRARRIGETEVKIATIRSKVDLATLPKRLGEAGLELCNALFGERFRQVDSLLAVALSNVNPQSHMALALCNFTRMEQAEAWGQSEHMTASVGRLLEAIDAERLALASAFGVTVRTMREHYSLTYGVPDAPLSETARMLAETQPVTLGPATIDTRYTLEDVPFGLLPLSELGRMAGVPMPLHAAGLAIFSALYGRELTAENDILPLMMAAGLSREQLSA